MRLARALSSGLALAGVARWAPPRGPLILMYHGLGGRDGIPEQDFAAQLDLLSSRRRVVPLREALQSLGEAESQELAAITFDDGYVDFAELAVPALQARGLHATLFVPVTCIGGVNEWDRGYAENRRILDAEALRDLDTRVVEIGAHGLRHQRLAGLDADTLREETGGACARLEEVCGREVRLFAYPYGQLDDFDAAAESALRRAGFHAACSTHFGRGSSSEERFRLRRVGVAPGESLREFALKLEGAYDWVSWKERLGKSARGLHRRIREPSGAA